MTRILVIDDNIEVREMLLLMLKRAGYRAIGVENGRVGINHHRMFPFDIIITDIIMPEKEGIETIIELKRDYPDVKIIAISGGGKIDSNLYLTMAEKFGADRVMAKPFDMIELLAVVEELSGAGS